MLSAHGAALSVSKGTEGRGKQWTILFLLFFFLVLDEKKKKSPAPKSKNMKGNKPQSDGYRH